MLVTAATGSTEVSHRSQRTLFRRDLDLDQKSRRAIIHPMNNDIASVRVQLLLCNARDLSVERFSRLGPVERN
jgi:hypothetical protein